MKPIIFIAVMLIAADLHAVQIRKPVSAILSLATPLNIGDKCPEIIFEHVLNYSEESVKLSAFKGKLVILDFWATWCVPCLRNLPKMDRLQSKYKDRLQVMLVAADEPDKVADFYRKAEDFSLPSAVLDSSSVIRQYFPFRVLPHYVVIDGNGIIRAITSAENITEENIQALLAGKTIELPQKKDYIAKNSKKEILLDTIGTIFQSTVKRHLAGSDGTLIFHSSGPYKNRAIKATNLSISLLYRIAYYNGDEFTGIAFPNERTVLEVNSPFTLDYPKNATREEKAEWQIDNTYCYELIVPPDRSAHLFEMMRYDLKRYFGYSARKELRIRECYVLVRKGESKLQTDNTAPYFDASVYWVKMKNQPLSRLVEALQRYSGIKVPIINETAWSENVDLKLNTNLRDISGLKKQLAAYGLDLIQTQRKIETLVLSDEKDSEF